MSILLEGIPRDRSEWRVAGAVNVESLLGADGFPLADELERADSKLIAVMRACLRGLKAGYEKALQKQFGFLTVESRHVLDTVCVAALLNPAWRASVSPQVSLKRRCRRWERCVTVGH